MKTLIIIPYFGIWPSWKEYFLKSCAHNPSIHWLLYTDAEVPADCPGNIRFESKILRDFNNLSSNKLDLRIDIKHPYKICDLRPAFGNIFSEYLDDYDFWGYADLDLIFGDISSFLPDELLKIHDVISVREDYLTGHFAIYRNNPLINNLYTKSAGYRQIFQDSDRHYAFDERSNFLGRKLPGNQGITGRSRIVQYILNGARKVRLRLNPDLMNDEFPDMTTIVKKSADAREIRYFHKDLVRSDLWFEKKHLREWEIIWENGTISDVLNGEEFLHFHLINSKKNKNFAIEPGQAGAVFRITAAGIEPVRCRN